MRNEFLERRQSSNPTSDTLVYWSKSDAKGNHNLHFQKKTNEHNVIHNKTLRMFPYSKVQDPFSWWCNLADVYGFRMDTYAPEIKRDIVFACDPELSKEPPGMAEFDLQVNSDVDSSWGPNGKETRRDT
jgi:hypothetical protein